MRGFRAVAFLLSGAASTMTATPPARNFVDDLIEMLGLHSSPCALDRALYVVVRHALGAGGENGAAGGVPSGSPPPVLAAMVISGELAESAPRFVSSEPDRLNLGHLLVPT